MLSCFHSKLVMLFFIQNINRLDRLIIAVIQQTKQKKKYFKILKFVCKPRIGENVHLILYIYIYKVVISVALFVFQIIT